MSGSIKKGGGCNTILLLWTTKPCGQSPAERTGGTISERCKLGGYEGALRFIVVFSRGG